MATTESLRDVGELLQLAILASRENPHDKAITLLKQGLEANPKEANLLFLLGAERMR